VKEVNARAQELIEIRETHERARRTHASETDELSRQLYVVMKDREDALGTFREEKNRMSDEIREARKAGGVGEANARARVRALEREVEALRRKLLDATGYAPIRGDVARAGSTSAAISAASPRSRASSSPFAAARSHASGYVGGGFGGAFPSIDRALSSRGGSSFGDHGGGGIGGARDWRANHSCASASASDEDDELDALDDEPRMDWRAPPKSPAPPPPPPAPPPPGAGASRPPSVVVGEYGGSARGFGVDLAIDLSKVKGVVSNDESDGLIARGGGGMNEVMNALVAGRGGGGGGGARPSSAPFTHR